MHFSGPRQRPQYARKELRAGPGGPRPVLLAADQRLTIPPIFRIADTHLHTAAGRKPTAETAEEKLSDWVSPAANKV